jgi:hypothetical protein
MRTLFLLIPILVVTSVKALDVESIREGSCGDHWFKIRFTVNLKTKAASLSCSGDSQTQCHLNGKLIQEEGDPSFQIQFDEPSKGYLSIDGTDHYHHIYYGAISFTGKSSDEQGLGLCSLN